MKNVLTFFIAFLVTVSTYGQGSTGSTGSTDSTDKTSKKTTTKKENNIPSDWKLFSNGTHSIQYPQDWTLDESGQMMTSFILFSPLESDYDLFKENVNLVIQDLAAYGMANMSLDSYVELSLSQMPNIIENYTLSSSERKTKNGKTYQEVVYTGVQMGYMLKWKQRVWLEDSKAYVLTFTGEETKFYSAGKIGTKIMDSIQKK
ncbi:MAG: hypothetical protein ACPGXZ_14805 [Saprospiraceae bacterium]